MQGVSGVPGFWRWAAEHPDTPAGIIERASVGEENFQWFIETVATFAIEEALKGRATPAEFRWNHFLVGSNPPTTGGVAPQAAAMATSAGDGATAAATAETAPAKGSKRPGKKSTQN